MIQVEAIQEGFALIVNGRRILSHSRRSSCLEIGTAENIVRQNRGSFKLRRRKVSKRALRSFTILESGPDFASFDFEGRVTMECRLSAGLLRVSFARLDPSTSYFRLRLAASPDERIFGGGEQYSRLDLKGSRLPLWVEEQGVGRGRDLLSLLVELAAGARGSWHSTYFPMPVFLSSAGYWCVFRTDAYTVFDFRRPALTLIESWAAPEELIIGFGSGEGARQRSPRSEAIVAELSSTLGRQKRLPDWVYDGIWLGAQGGSAEARRKTEAAIAAGAKIGAVWVQDWCGRRETKFARQLMWNWKADASAYPELRDDIEDWRSRGIRFLGYVNPFLALEGDLYAEASARGFCVKNADGQDYHAVTTSFPAAMVDLSNTEAFAWLKAVITREMIGVGMSGWMADFAEYLPADAVLASGEDARLVHNRWPLLWARLNAEAIAEAGREGELVFFMRSGWLGCPALASAFWAGDQLANFSKDDGLPSLVPAALSLGLCGAAYWHSDVGGYHSLAWVRRDRECLERWAEMAAFTPIFRSHEGSRPDSAAQFWSDPDSLRLLARMSEIYASLKPYHLAAAEDYEKRGLPPMRHPWIHYPEDPAAAGLSYQYLYGRDLMVAPTLGPGRQLTELYLPDDEWIHLWSSRTFHGGSHGHGGRLTVDSPRGCPAVFYRASSPFAELFDAIRRTARRL